MSTPYNSDDQPLPRMLQEPGWILQHLPPLPGVEAPAQCPQCGSARYPYDPDWFYEPEDGWYTCGAVLIPEDGWMIEEEPCLRPPLRHTVHLLHHWLTRLGADAADAAAALAPIVSATPPIGWMEDVFLIALGYCHDARWANQWRR